MVEISTPVEVFCCYSHVDEGWLRKLETHLSLLKRQGLITLWHDRLIPPGIDWAKTIDTHLEMASVILLLVSPDFLASDYCYSIEMKRALERHAANEARVVPILVRPVDWTDAPFAHLQALPTDAKPIAVWRSKERALVDIAAGIRRVIEDVPLLAASAPRAALPAIWNIPYPRNPFFLGRDDELTQVRQNLRAGQATALSQPQAISGLGGIGKSQLALEYAYRYHQDYQIVLWARAESAEALFSSYVVIATLLRLPERDAKEQEIIVQAVKTWLQAHRDWLLILDNADELALLPDFLPPSLGGHLLLTTRAVSTGRLAHRLEIETLLPEQGALLLLRRAGLIAPDAELLQAPPQERKLAQRIAQELGGLPLALDQAGAYLEATGTDLANYWVIYQQHRTSLLQERRELIPDHPAPVATTWSLSFQLVEKKNPAAADLLRLCAYLAPDAIAEEILIEGASSLGPVLAAVAGDDFRLNQAIEALRAYSLVRRDPREKTLSIHRLVQVVLRDSMQEQEQEQWVKRIITAVNAVFPDVKHETWSQCERLVPHALMCATHTRLWKDSNLDLASLLFKAASYLHDRAQYGEVESLYQRVLGIYEQELGAEHRKIADILMRLALLYYQHGKYAQAEPLYQRELRIREQVYGVDHHLVAAALNNMAMIYYMQGKYTQAEPLYQRALHIAEQTFGAEHSRLTATLTNLAILYSSQEKFALAEQFYQRARLIHERAWGLEDRDLAFILNGLAGLYYAQGDYVQAESLYQRALHNWEQGYGPEHPLVAHALDGLANLYALQGNYTNAELYYQRALRVQEQVFGLVHHQVADSLQGLANLYYEQGDYVQAESLYQRALFIREQIFGPEHRDVAPLLSKLAKLYKEQGKYAEADPLYRRALLIREQQFGLGHPNTVEVIYDLAELREAQSNSEEARALYTRALAVRERALGAQHPETTEIRTRLIALLHAMEQHEEAAKLEVTQAEL